MKMRPIDGQWYLFLGDNGGYWAAFYLKGTGDFEDSGEFRIWEDEVEDLFTHYTEITPPT